MVGKGILGQGNRYKGIGEVLKIIETRPLFAHVAMHNVASHRVLEKCGFKVVSEDRYTNPAGVEVKEFVLKLD